MKYISTRSDQYQYTLSEAFKQGLSREGGLIIPEHFPRIDFSKLNASLDYYDKFASILLKPFFAGDVLEPELKAICKEAFSFSIPLTQLNLSTFMLELYHGPTLSFKDVGARFLACCLSRLAMQKNQTIQIQDTQKPITILVATSGDTGSAVAAAFYQQKATQVIVLFPKGQISERQQKQITCWGDNVIAVAVEGTFDDCQALVKQAFAEKLWQDKTDLNTANSINLGRLLPQMTYYAYHSLKFYSQTGQKAGFIVPSGNVGNVTAAFWAKQLGFPIREIVMATNSNRTLFDYSQTGKFEPRPSCSTLASAMDVGNPSNFERLKYLFSDFDQFANQVKVFSVSDQEIKQSIQMAFDKDQKIICPHTATAYYVRQKLDHKKPWVIVSTADPCKFENIVEPLIEKPVPPTASLDKLLNKPQRYITIEPTLKALELAYLKSFVKIES